MVTDNRQVHLNAAGQVFDTSKAPAFDYPRFYADMREGEQLQISRDELTWLQSYRTPDSPADVVLNLSCGVQTTPHLMLTQIALFEALGIDFVATAGPQYCCGRIYQRFGKDETGDRMAAKAISHFQSWQPTTNVQCCGSCFIEFDYHVAKKTEADGAAPFDVVHITRYLLDRLRELGDAVPWQRPERTLRVLLHAEGSEVHPTKEVQRSDVIDTLAMVPGVEFAGLVDNPSFGSPCATKGPGEPSVLNDLTDAQYRQVLAELREQADAAGADAIVTHHHFCHREWSKFGTSALPVIHYQSLMAEALGRSVPDRFQSLWRLGDPEQVLQQSRPHWSSWGVAEDKAREMVAKHFVTEYAASVQRCPCEGSCHEAVAGNRGNGAVCGTSWHSTLGDEA
jgi:uncharacterized protein YbjQ (UPF0145 family)